MAKIVLLGAGSSIFCKNVLGDCLLTPSLADAEIALCDIDGEKLAQSERLIRRLNEKLGTKATITASTDRRAVLKGADYVINTISV